MLITTAVGLFLGAWSLILLFDHYLRTRNFDGYVKVVEKTGLVVNPFHIRLYAGSRFQRFLDQFTCLKSPNAKRFLDLWFLIGVAVSISCSFFMLYLLCGTLIAQMKFLLMWFGFRTISSFNDTAGAAEIRETNVSASGFNSQATYFTADDQGDYLTKQSAIGIVPVIPGLNLPWSHAPLLFVVLIIAGILHELGHAIAAINERVTINGFGIFLLGVYPGAFTELHGEALYSLDILRRLKIFCGGIWHNLVTALFSMLCISLLPKLLSFGYTVNKGVIVTDVHVSSGLHDIGGLKRGDVVYEINYCKVYDEESWANCLRSMARQNGGYCIPRLKMRLASKMTQKFKMDEHGELKCCQPNTTASHMCFYYKMGNNHLNSTASYNETFSYSCLPARYVTDHFVCNYSKPCGGFQTVCVYPALFNNTKLFRFQLDVKRNANPNDGVFGQNSTVNNNNNVKRQPVLFIGHPKSVLDHVTVSSYVPRPYISEKVASFIVPLWLPKFLDLFFRYLFTFSLAFALLNAVPCYTLDGQFIWSVLMIDLRSSSANNPSKNSRLLADDNDGVIINSPVSILAILFYKLVMFLGTLILLSVVLLGLWFFFVTTPSITNI